MPADSDLNNSLSFYFLDEGTVERTNKLNLAAAPGDERNRPGDSALPARVPGIDLVASTPYLADLRTLNEKRLKRVIPALYGKYDIMIIDCRPTCGNIVLNTFHAADYIITPVLRDIFSYNAAVFMGEALPRDAEDLKNRFILINGYNRRFAESAGGQQDEFLNLCREGNFPLTPSGTWLPWTAQIHHAVDCRRGLANQKGISGTVHNPELYSAIAELAGCFFDKALPLPEVF